MTAAVDAGARTARAGGVALPARTGVMLVPDSVTAFALRSRAAREAGRTLDLQYYMWDEDVTGQLLARDVLAAADRGVRVRLLLDDLYVRRTERALASLICHPGIEVRLYNPFQLRHWGVVGDLVEFMFASYRLNHRMHNKAWIADRRLAVCGGRNIGDAYFDASGQFNFRDLDLLLTGGGAAQAVGVFDRYWNNRRVRPISQVATLKPTGADLAEFRRRLEANAGSAAAAAFLDRVGQAPAVRDRVEVDTASVRVVADPPGKGGRGRGSRPEMLTAVRGALAAARRRVLLISPYFVPGRRGARQLQHLARSGVEVTVLTNSLAATDVLAVHGGYAHYRRRLLRAGITLFELKRGGGQPGQSLFGSGRASLHTKAFVVDDELVFVGSFNLDPRSAYVNTEMGTFVHHPGLALELRREFDRMTDPERSWAVALAGLRLAWTDTVDGRARVLRHEPDSSPARRIVARVLGWLPLEPQL